ncbi:MAG: TRAP transporter substrate-binding protein [Alphaproteobacteria bacterium]
MLKLVKRSALAGIALALVAFSAPIEGKAAEYTLRLNHSLPVTHLRQIHAELFAKTIADVTKGAVEVTIFPAGQLYKKDAHAINAIRAGSLEGAMVSGAALSLFEPGFELLELPFLITSYKELNAVLDSPVGAKIMNGLGNVGLKGLVFTPAGSSIILNNIRPLTDVDSFKGLRLRSSAGRVQIASFQLLGASGITLPFGEVAPALQRKTIDGVYTSVAAAAAGKLGKQSKYATWTKQQFFSPVIILNKGWFEKLPAEHVKAIEAAMPGYYKQALKINQDNEAESLVSLKSQGTEVIEELSPDAKKRMIDKLTPLHSEYRDKVGAALFDEIVAAVNSVK